jgi:AbrB family looped-hinge helix DNA binding protein
MRVTTKGQVTIPKPVRDRLGIRPGSEVQFELAEDGRAYLRRVGERQTTPSLLERMRGTATGGLTTDENHEADPRRGLMTLVDTNVLLDIATDDPQLSVLVLIPARCRVYRRTERFRAVFSKLEQTPNPSLAEAFAPP